MRLRINKCIVAGNIVDAPTLTTLKNGNKVCNTSIAINESYLDKDKERKEITTFLDITAWDYRAERLSQAKVGDNVYIVGRLRQDVWEAEDGSRRSKIKIVVDEIQNLSFTKIVQNETKDSDEEPLTEVDKDEEERRSASPPPSSVRKPFRA